MRSVGLPTPERQALLIPGRKLRWDFAWPELLVCLEVDGGTWIEGAHNRGKRIEADCEKQCLAAIAGYRTLRVTGDQVRDGRALAFVERALSGRVSSGPSTDRG